MFDLMDNFAGYGFVKPHSTCYALIAFQTAYLKKHYPAEFMAATLSSEMGSSNRVVILLEECKRMGLTVHSPDVNESFADFIVTDGGIRFGLGAVKNVGKNAIEAIVQEREQGGRFTNIFEFCERIDSRQINKKVLESLVQAGAMDSLEGHRAQKLLAVEMALGFAQTAQSQRRNGQTTLFDEADSAFQYPQLPVIAEWSSAEALAFEKEMLGFYLSGHPLNRFKDEVNIFSTFTLEAIDNLADGTNVKVCGIVTECKNILDRNNNPMAFVTLEDFYGSKEVIVFSKIFDKYRDYLEADSMILVKGRISIKEEEDIKILCDEIVPLEDVWERYAKNLYLTMELAGVDDPVLNQVTRIVQENPGECNLFINLKVQNNPKQTIKSKTMKVNPAPEVIMNLRSILGQENVWMEG
jgi:DNA polymerase-3 subunit alpha